MNNNDKSTPVFEWTVKIFMFFYFVFIFFLNGWSLKDGTANSFEYVGVGFFAALGLTCTLACLYKGRQRENLRFQPGDESRLGRPLL